MSLYFEAGPFLLQGQTGSLKSRIFASKLNKSSPTQIYALVSEASKWSAVLKEVVENSGLLLAERKVYTYAPPLFTSLITTFRKPVLTNVEGFPVGLIISSRLLLLCCWCMISSWPSMGSPRRRRIL